MKNLLIIYSEYTSTVDAIKYHNEEYANIICLQNPDKNTINSYNPDLTVLSKYNHEYTQNALCIHHSLLPAFADSEPEKSAIINSAKVTGVTVYYINPNRIIAQYPIFIHNNQHWEELKQELSYLEQTFFPLVIKKILKNEPFESQSLMNFNSKCGGCSGCKH